MHVAMSEATAFRVPLTLRHGGPRGSAARMDHRTVCEGMLDADALSVCEMGVRDATSDRFITDQSVQAKAFLMEEEPPEG